MLVAMGIFNVILAVPWDGPMVFVMAAVKDGICHGLFFTYKKVGVCTFFDSDW